MAQHTASRYAAGLIKAGFERKPQLDSYYATLLFEPAKGTYRTGIPCYCTPAVLEAWCTTARDECGGVWQAYGFAQAPAEFVKGMFIDVPVGAEANQ